MSFTKTEQTLGLSPPLPWGSLHSWGLSVQLLCQGRPWPPSPGWGDFFCGPGHLRANTTRSPQTTALPCPLLCRSTAPPVASF